MKLNELDKQKSIRQKRLKDELDKEAMKNFDYKELMNNDIPRVLGARQKTSKLNVDEANEAA